MSGALGDQDRFEELVIEALEGLPEWVKRTMENVDVLVEDAPPRGQPGLLGLYEGIPLSQRGSGYAGALPDRITLFRWNIERQARGSSVRLTEIVRHTVVHEIAHHFGISDDRLRELDVY
jgi:predicted Zn-dependent protease with MMP-like domain